jgi:hypothetical protein
MYKNSPHYTSFAPRKMTDSRDQLMPPGPPFPSRKRRAAVADLGHGDDSPDKKLSKQEDFEKENISPKQEISDLRFQKVCLKADKANLEEMV